MCSTVGGIQLAVGDGKCRSADVHCESLGCLFIGLIMPAELNHIQLSVSLLSETAVGQ